MEDRWFHRARPAPTATAAALSSGEWAPMTNNRSIFGTFIIFWIDARFSGYVKSLRWRIRRCHERLRPDETTAF
jgi:hypothetical protein